MAAANCGGSCHSLENGIRLKNISLKKAACSAALAGSLASKSALTCLRKSRLFLSFLFGIELTHAIGLTLNSWRGVIYQAGLEIIMALPTGNRILSL
jgi:hypothetical protein